MFVLRRDACGVHGLPGVVRRKRISGAARYSHPDRQNRTIRFAQEGRLPVSTNGDGAGLLRARVFTLGRGMPRPYGPAHPWRGNQGDVTHLALLRRPSQTAQTNTFPDRDCRRSRRQIRKQNSMRCSMDLTVTSGFVSCPKRDQNIYAAKIDAHWPKSRAGIATFNFQSIPIGREPSCLR